MQLIKHIDHINFAMRFFSAIAICLSVLLLQACSTPTNQVSGFQPSTQSASELSNDENQLVADTVWTDPQWQHVTLPAKKPTKYMLATRNGRKAMRAQSEKSASMLRRDVSISAADLDVLKFSWHVTTLIASADIAERDLDDSPARLILVFKGDKRKFSPKNAMLSEMAQVISGEPLPYATLMYVWSNKKPTGSIVMNPRTDRVRSIVVESGDKNVGKWRDYERQIRADFEMAFGEPAGDLQSIGIMTDSDNTQSQAATYYGSLLLAKK